MEHKFDIVFIRDAEKDYQKLDGSEKKYVDVSLAKIMVRADEIGEGLTKKGDSNLIDCKKVKLKKIGIRMVFRIIAQTAEIIAIGKREDDEVYKEAAKRLSK